MEKITFKQVVQVGCGIDVHKDIIVATIRKSENTYETKEFISFTSSLTALKEWCTSEKVTHIAMESTGIYWKPVFNILEEGEFEIILVNARHVRNIPGHKTDKKDSYLKRKYESLVGSRGRKKALIAVGHKIIIAAYHIIKNKEAYKEPILHHNQKRKTKQINNLLSKLKELGMEIKQADLIPTV